MSQVVMLIGFMLELLSKLTLISGIIKDMSAEGRDKLTVEEWAKLDEAYSASRKNLTDAIAKAKAEGR